MIALALIPIVSILSALDGYGGFSPKWPLKAVMALACAGVAYLSGIPLLYALPVGLVCMAAYFWVCRSGRVCDAEMKCMAEPTGKHFLQVALAYTPYLALVACLSLLPYIGGQTPLSLKDAGLWYALATIASVSLPLLSLRIWNYKTKRGQLLAGLDEDGNVIVDTTGRFWDCRRMTEICNGWVGGIGSLAIIEAIARFC